MTHKGDVVAFIEAAIAAEHDECIPWPYGKVPQGYGTVRHQGKTEYAHRLVCERIHGPPPAQGYHAAHSCGKGHLGCINPRHLRWATPVENYADAVRHGTKPMPKAWINQLEG